MIDRDYREAEYDDVAARIELALEPFGLEDELYVVMDALQTAGVLKS